MNDCTSPEHLIAVLASQWPALPGLGWLVAGVAVLALLIEFGMRFRYGGIPDGLLGGFGLVLLGVAGLIWAGSWPPGCGGMVSIAAAAVTGFGVLLGAVVLLFWNARKRDGGMLVRDYDNDFPGVGR